METALSKSVLIALSLWAALVLGHIILVFSRTPVPPDESFNAVLELSIIVGCLTLPLFYSWLHAIRRTNRELQAVVRFCTLTTIIAVETAFRFLR